MSLLEVHGITMRFGGLTALREVTFSVDAGEIVGIVGPNGAGKSTLFDVISGVYTPTAGRVTFLDRDVTRLPPHQMCRLGVARTFQKMRPFAEMTVEQNVAVGALLCVGSVRVALEDARRILAQVGLDHMRLVYASGLSTGQRKRLEMARALATRPQLLLLDEVTGGVDIRSIPSLLDVIKATRDSGVTILVIEHNMGVITGLSDRVVALHLGRKLAEGPPEVVMRDPRVADAYLGTVSASS